MEKIYHHVYGINIEDGAEARLPEPSVVFSPCHPNTS